MRILFDGVVPVDHGQINVTSPGLPEMALPALRAAGPIRCRRRWRRCGRRSPPTPLDRAVRHAEVRRASPIVDRKGPH
jgi:hypothetical protein